MQDEFFKNRMNGKLIMSIFKGLSAGLLAVVLFAGCSDTPPPKRPVAVQKQPSAAAPAAQPPLSELLAEDTSAQQGYIYERKNRRDPFIPLILPTQKVLKKDGLKTGTLESYDIGEFTLAAIAKKGTERIALLVAPDNRSFTVYKGTGIGLYNGTVKEISDKKVVLVEYSRDYTGAMVPREIILELNKGEGN